MRQRVSLTTIGLWVWTSFAWISFTGVAAQSLETGMTLGASQVEPAVVLSDLDLRGLELGIRAAGGLTGPLELGVRVRDSFDFGPIGRVNLEGRADVDTSGGFEIAAQGDGVLGSLGARLRLSVFNVNPEHFELSRGFTTGVRPRYDEAQLVGEVGFGVGVGGTYRLSRQAIIDVDPQLNYLSALGFGLNVRSSLQLRSLVDRDDGVVRFLADIEPSGAGFAATGFEYRLNRSGIPTVDMLLWVGAGSRGVSPGLRLRIGERDQAAGTRASFSVAVEPFRTDVWPYRLEAEVAVGALELALLGAVDNAELAVLALTGSYRWRF